MKYLYEISGFYVHQPSPGEYNEGQLAGEAVIYDYFNEITDPVNPYDEWFVHSYSINAAGYSLSGINGKIERYINSNSLRIDNPSWQGESEDIYIVHTGPNAIPVESMSFNSHVPEPGFFDLEDGTSMKITTIRFEKRRIVDTCPPRCFLSFLCEWLCRLFGKK